MEEKRSYFQILVKWNPYISILVVSAPFIVIFKNSNLVLMIFFIFKTGGNVGKAQSIDGYQYISIYFRFKKPSSLFSLASVHTSLLDFLLLHLLQQMTSYPFIDLKIASPILIVSD